MYIKINQVRRQTILLNMLVFRFILCIALRENKPNKPENHKSILVIMFL